MKTVKIKDKVFSKVVFGTNAIYGRSHFSHARDVEYSHRNTDAYIKKMLSKCMELGINAVETSANERIMKIISDLEAETKSCLLLIGNTRIDNTSAMKSHHEKFHFLIEHQADVCIIHSQFVDRPRKTNEIRGLKVLVDQIHDTGLIAGISTHRISTVELCEDLGYNIDVYLFPLNSAGFMYPGYDGNESVEARIDLINSVDKPFILMKTLAAGRITPEEGLKFVLDHMKPIDILTLGLSSLEEAEESLEIIQEYI